METIRWGIISTGAIAAAMAADLNTLADADLLAVGSRTQASADDFGDRYSIPRRYASYEDLARDPDIDIVYIGTPHPFHADNIRLCLENGKHVLCEKPLTLNADQAQACFDLAREKGLFLMEAMWMRFIPAVIQARDWVQQGRIGRVRMIQANFTIAAPFDPNSRIFNLELGGGALLDVGIYPINFAHMLLGVPDDVTSFVHLGQTDVDEYEHIVFHYDDGNCIAALNAAVNLNGPRHAVIYGEKGYIRVHEDFWYSQRLTLVPNGAAPETVDVPFTANGYVHEVADVHRCLRAGAIESSVMPAHTTLEIMRIMDDLRATWGLTYPAEIPGETES